MADHGQQPKAKHSADPGQCKKTKEKRCAPNAGVMLVGNSAQHSGVPAALLGGRFYTGKKAYVYTDFGGGVDRDESPQQGAFREFAEELLGQGEEEAKSTACKLCATCELVGGTSFIHKGYAMFIVAAETIVEALELPYVAEGMSSIDQLFALAKQNLELTSVALVSLEELIRGATSDGSVCALIVRHLDGQDRDSAEVQLRQVMVGGGGSITTIRDTLETFMNTHARTQGETASLKDTDHLSMIASASENTLIEVSKSRRRRWNQTSSGYLDTTVSANSSAPAPKAQALELTPYVFDMETGDPDDVLTLLMLGSRPDIELRAVTITPGSQEQVALVRWLLQEMGLTHVRLGAQDWPLNSSKPVSLNTKFYKNFGRAPRGEPQCERADLVLLECCSDDVTLVTGAALHNLGAALRCDGFRLGRWVAQGGFAGEGVVPRERQMEKFMGMETCSTWNFCGNIPAAQAALASSAIARKICVSKNVCHSVNYDEDFHAALGAVTEAERRVSPNGKRAIAFTMMHGAMDSYLRHKPGGKKLHDPLALAVAIDESVCEVAEVQLYCNKGKWGSRLSPGSGIFISVAYDAEKFVKAVLH